MDTKAFRFGVIAETFTSASAWLDLAMATESLGYDTLLVRDHFIEEPFGHQFAPFSAFAGAAAVTSTLRLGTLVIDNDYRHPAVLAKESATLDLLSGGRFELGLGASWLKEEYERTGIPFDPPGTRIARLEESIRILRGLLRGEQVEQHGTHYQIAGLENFPPPAQTRLPLLIGGGSPRILRLAGRQADIVGILTTSVATGVRSNDPEGRRISAVAQRLQWIKEGAGDRFEEIELSLLPTVIMTSDRCTATDQYIRDQGWTGVSREDVWDMPSVMIGSVDEIAEQLVYTRKNLAISYFIVTDARLVQFAPLVRSLRGQ